MTKRKIQVGQAGEIAARDYLLKNGYKIIQTNFRCHLGEIDIIANQNGIVIFVEVRTRTTTSYGRPEESITAEKAHRLRRLTLQYIQAVYKKEVPCRIDMIAVMLNKDNLSVNSLNHLEGILSG